MAQAAQAARAESRHRCYTSRAGGRTSAEMTLTLMSFSTLTISTSSPGRSSVLMWSVLNAESSLCWMLMTVSTERLRHTRTAADSCKQLLQPLQLPRLQCTRDHAAAAAARAQQIRKSGQSAIAAGTSRQLAHLERAPSGVSMLLSALRARMPQASSSPDSGWNSSRLFRIVSRISSSRRDFRIFSLHGATDASHGTAPEMQCYHSEQACSWMSASDDMTSSALGSICAAQMLCGGRALNDSSGNTTLTWWWSQ